MLATFWPSIVKSYQKDMKNYVIPYLGHATAAFTLNVYAHATEQMNKVSADKMQQPYQKKLHGRLLHLFLR